MTREPPSPLDCRASYSTALRLDDLAIPAEAAGLAMVRGSTGSCLLMPGGRRVTWTVARFDGCPLARCVIRSGDRGIPLGLQASISQLAKMASSASRVDGLACTFAGRSEWITHRANGQPSNRRKDRLKETGEDSAAYRVAQTNCICYPRWTRFSRVRQIPLRHRRSRYFRPDQHRVFRNANCVVRMAVDQPLPPFSTFSSYKSARYCSTSQVGQLNTCISGDGPVDASTATLS